MDVPTAATVAHAISECSNQGFCDRATGQCVCYSGFEGDACQRCAYFAAIPLPRACWQPNFVFFAYCDAASCPNACSGHGKCVSVKQMAGEQNAMPVGPTAIYGGFEVRRRLAYLATRYGLHAVRRA